MENDFFNYKFFCFLASFILFSVILQHGNSQKLVEFDGHLLQKIKEKDQEFGSWRAGLKGTVILASEMVQPNSRRGIAYTNLIDIALNQQLFDTLIERSTGLIITIPKDIIKFLEEKYDSSLHNVSRTEYVESSLTELKEFELKLLNRKFLVPLYFAWQIQELTDMYKRLEFSNKLFNSRVTVTTKLSEPKVIESIKGYNFVGWILQNPQTEDKPISTVAIVAHYDISTIVPGLSIDSPGTSSGLLAFITLVHQFGSLMKESSLSSHRILFLLMSGATSDYFGIRHWLSKTDHLLLDSIDFAICLDSLGDSELYLHLSKPTKTNPANKIIKAFENSSIAYGQNLNVFINKINISGPNNFPHEPFARQGIQAATFSNLNESSSSSRKSILNNKISSLQEINLKNQIKIIAEAIGHYIFELDNYKIELFDKVDSFNTFFNSWKNGLENTPRFFRTMKKTDLFFSEIESLFVSYLKNYTKLDFILTNDPVEYYEDNPVNLVLKNTKNPLFDAFHLFFNIIYLTIIYLIVSRGKGFNQIKNWIYGTSTKTKLM